MRHSSALLLTLAVGACTPAEPKAEDTDRAVGGDTDSGNTEETGTPNTDPTPVTFVYDADATGLRISLVEFIAGGSSLSSETWASFAAAGSEQTIELPVPPESAVFVSADGTYADYLVALYEDTDASGTQDPGEDWVSADRYAMWVPEPLSEELTAAGFTAGWNVRPSARLKSFPLNAVPMALHRPADSVTVGGPIGDVPADTALGVVLPALGGLPPLSDGPVDGEAWSMTLSGTPPEEYLLESLKMATGNPALYLDYGMVGYDRVDTIHGAACLNNAWVLLAWAKLDDLEVYLAYSGLGVVPGWFVGTYAYSGAPFEAIPAEQLNAIPMTQACG